MFFEAPHESRRFPVIAGDNFDFDDIVDKIHAAVFPGALIGRGLGTNCQGAESSDQVFTDLFEFFRFDLAAIVIFQRQVNLVLFHAARGDLGRRTLLLGTFLNAICFRLSSLMCSGVTP